MGLQYIETEEIMLPETGYVRLKQIIGDPKKGTAPLIPVSASTWWAGVKSGRYPQGILDGGMRLWPVEDIRDLIARIGRAA